MDGWLASTTIPFQMTLRARTQGWNGYQGERSYRCRPECRLASLAFLCVISNSSRNWNEICAQLCSPGCLIRFNRFPKNLPRKTSALRSARIKTLYGVFGESGVSCSLNIVALRTLLSGTYASSSFEDSSSFVLLVVDLNLTSFFKLMSKIIKLQVNRWLLPFTAHACTAVCRVALPDCAACKRYQ